MHSQPELDFTTSPYSGGVGYQKGSVTSESAAQYAESKAQTLRGSIYRMILKAGTKGATRDDVLVDLKLHLNMTAYPSTVSARLRELTLSGAISVLPDTTRMGMAGCKQQVFVVAMNGEAFEPSKRRTYQEGLQDGYLKVQEQIRHMVSKQGGWPAGPALRELQDTLEEWIKKGA